MKNIQNLIFTDFYHKDFLPLTFFKPFAELRSGIFTFRQRWELLTNLKTTGYFTENYLLPLYNSPSPGISLIINPNIVPTQKLIEKILQINTGESLWMGDLFIAALTNDIPVDWSDVQGYFKQNTSPSQISNTFEIECFTRPWELFLWNQKMFAIDINLLPEDFVLVNEIPGVFIKGAGIYMHPSAIIQPGTVINATSGPVILDKHSEIMEGCMIRGPFYLGEHAQLKMGAKIYGPTTIGPYCKVGGEVNNSIFTAYSNKAHDGFIGNSVIGEWVNLGADTNNSNLKNNYSEVTVWSYKENGWVNTGLQFCGLIMGDHAKSAINTQFNTGTVCGPFANIFMPGFPPKHIPAFSWGGHRSNKFQLDKAIDMIHRVMERRQVKPTEEYLMIVEHVYQHLT
jgi:UDP-N-acetylglucosamine diphosphorylase/glucosamine-1-phosphate N-acetyltransferase